MAFLQLFSLIPPELIEAKRSVVNRWTGSDSSGPWEPAPDYGTFVDDAGMVVMGLDESRATLTSDDPRLLALDPGLDGALPAGTTVAFLDWGRQSLSWEEIFDLWEAWESQGMVLDSGAVGVPWRLADRWVAPGWVAFQGDFDGAPLSTVVRSGPQGLPVGTEGSQGEGKNSFLAKALELRGESGSVVRELPMLPFTLESLTDPRHLWPLGVA